MANTIAGVSLQDVAVTTLPHLRYALLPIKALFTDISDEIAAGASSVVTRIPTLPTAVDVSGGYTASDISMTPVTVTLNNMYGFPYGFTDYERSRSAVDLNQMFIEPAVNALGAKILSDIVAVINGGGNFTLTVSSSAANFSRTTLVDIAATMTTNKFPTENRAVFLAPAYKASLVKTLFAAEWPGQFAEKAEGLVPRTTGFDIYETNVIAPSTAGDLAGFAFHKSAIVFASRRIAEPINVPNIVEVLDVTVPDLNIPVQFRRWYDATAGKLMYSVALLYGVAKGAGYGVKILYSTT
jgi:hypothetical protein